MPVCPRFRTLILTVLLALFGASVASAQTQTVPEACDPEPVDEISSGHTALFDVYWDPETETLNNNPCPPTVVHHPGEDDGRGNVTPPTTTRTPTAIDIGHTIIHVPESARQTVTANGNGDYDGTGYEFLRAHTPRPAEEGTTEPPMWDVWIIPSCDTTPAPTYCLGFSAGLLQADDWVNPDDPDGDPKVQYEFESIREPGHAVQGRGEVYVFEVVNSDPEITWRTDNADTNELHLAPGEYEHSYWAFTAEGTYEFAVHVKGHPASTISSADTVTSEVRRYTFHVGNLAVNHDPVFEVERSVSENAIGGTRVGSPVVVKDLDATTLCFALTGHGAENFTLEGTTGTEQCGTMTAVTRSNERIGAQITVKERSYLDYETTPAYDLRLQVTDGEDPESNPDSSIDDSIAVHIAVADGPDNVRGSSLTLHAPASATVGESITLSVSFGGGWPTTPGDITFRWHRRVAGGVAETGARTTGVAHHTETFDRSGAVEYWVAAQWREGHLNVPGATRVLESDIVTVNWQ